MDPETMLYDGLIPSLEEVGARFERGDFFVPEMLIAARAMQGALDILRPLLAETGAKPVGTFVMGTVKGDVHDIGKNLVNIMLEGAGFTVHDLGVNVAPEKFVEQVVEHEPDIVGFSAFLTTTMPMFKANINALEKAGLRDKVIVMVGRRAGHPGVRRRGRRGRLRGRRLDRRAQGQGPDRVPAAGGGHRRERCGRSPPARPGRRGQRRGDAARRRRTAVRAAAVRHARLHHGAARRRVGRAWWRPRRRSGRAAAFRSRTSAPAASPASASWTSCSARWPPRRRSTTCW